MKLFPYIDALLKYFNFVDDGNTTKNDDKKNDTINTLNSLRIITKRFVI